MHVVDLVRAGVGEILALQVDPGAAGVLGEPRGERERRRPPDVVAQQRVELRAEFGIGARRLVLRRELIERGNERLGHVPAAERAESTHGVGNGSRRGHADTIDTPR